MAMQRSERKSYTASRFTLADLRQIVAENVTKPPNTGVDISVTPRDRPFDSEYTTITVQ